MNCVIPFTKEIKFNTNIYEVLSISLEHDYTLNEEELLGNFKIFGEYKTHEVSVNKESFEYVLPFSVNLTSPIEEDTLDFNIEDFTYEVIDNNTLKVDIEYSIKAKEKEVETLEFSDVEKIEEEKIIDEALTNNDEETREDISQEEEVIMNAVSEKEDEFVTYHIHIMKENDTIETVCSKYNTNESILENYNDLKNLTLGDKLIIPDIDE